MSKRAPAIGIDFGTSNSAAAFVAEDGLARPLLLEGSAIAIPTAIFFNSEDRSTHFGREAMALYLAGTEGRANTHGRPKASKSPNAKLEIMMSEKKDEKVAENKLAPKAKGRGREGRDEEGEGKGRLKPKGRGGDTREWRKGQLPAIASLSSEEEEEG